MDPDEISAWGPVHASLEQQSRIGNGFSVESMNAITTALASSSIPDKTKTLANQYWQDYGAQIMSSVGYTP